MLIASAPLLLAAFGLFFFYAAQNPKTVEVGKIMFFVGLLVATLGITHVAMKLL
jgi:Na+/phosphate symporter